MLRSTWPARRLHGQYIIPFDRLPVAVETPSDIPVSNLVGSDRMQMVGIVCTVLHTGSWYFVDVLHVRSMPGAADRILTGTLWFQDSGHVLLAG